MIVANTSPVELQTLLRQYVGSLQFDAGSTPDFSVGYRDPIQARLELPINNHANTQYFVRMIAPVRTADAKTVFMDDLLMRIVNKRLTAVVRENQVWTIHLLRWP